MSANSNGPYVIGTSGSSGGAGGSGTVWVTSTPTTTSSPYVVTTTGSSASYGTVGVTSTWIDTTVGCKFCDKAIEIGLVIQSKGKSVTHVCTKCAKELMGGDRIKELLDLIEALATTAELAKT